MARFAGRLIRAFAYGMVLGPIMAVLASAAGALMSALSGTSLPLTPQQFALLGGVIGFAAPIAIDLSNQYEETSKQ